MRRKFLWMASLMMLTMSLQAESIESRLLGLHNGNTSYVALFEETKAMPKLNKETKKRGILYFSYAGELSMRYSEPDGDYNIIRCDGKFLTLRGGKKMDIPMNEKHPTQFVIFRNTLLLSMRGDVASVAKENGATLTCTENSKQFVCRIEKNKQQKVGVVSLDLIYDKQTGGLQLLRLNEANGNYTEYSASSGKMNAAIPQEVWKE